MDEFFRYLGFLKYLRSVSPEIAEDVENTIAHCGTNNWVASATILGAKYPEYHEKVRAMQVLTGKTKVPDHKKEKDNEPTE